MKKTYNDIIDETLYYDKMENGLEVYFIPKEGYIDKYAVLGVDFGSNDLEFVPLGKNEKIKVNEGIAHFLEHKMFEQPDGGNVFDDFNKLGAYVNAYTGFNMTSYLFQTTENFYEALERLITFVQTPYYTDENVEKEKDIIVQEIKMYEDDPHSVVNFNCLKAMYSNHNIRIDIGGSESSVRAITPKELYTCYHTFYNPANMKLFVIGDLDFSDIIDTVEKVNNCELDFCKDIVRVEVEEPISVSKKEICVYMPVSAPLVQIGYKDKFRNLVGKDKLKLELVTDILFDIIFSESAEFISNLYNKGLVVTTPTGGYTLQKDYAYSIVYYISKQPKLVKKKIDEYISSLKKENLDKHIFEITKKKKIGKFLSSFDSISYVANNFLSYKMKGVDLLDYLEVLKSITIEDCEKRLSEFLDEENSVISIVYPLKEEGEYIE